MFISVVSTVLNEARNIQHLLDHLIVQEPPFEIIIVDAGSTDGTLEILARNEREHPEIMVLGHGGSRGEGRNFGIHHASGEVVAFTDGDCLPNPFWLKEIRKGIREEDAGGVAGRSVTVGYAPFVDLGRIELYARGMDVTYPSCNLAYRREILEELRGFDPWFMTAEDIDLNLRAVESGEKLVYRQKAIVVNLTRSTFGGFFKQAFWNGYGRKQLTLKHGRLWTAYRPGQMFQGNPSIWWVMRMGFAFIGYFAAKLTLRKAGEGGPAMAYASERPGTMGKK